MIEDKAPNNVLMGLLRVSYGLSFRLRRFYTMLVLSRLYGKLGHGAVIYPQRMVRYPGFITVGRNSILRYGGRIEMILHGQDWQPQLNIGDGVNIEQNVHIICHDRIEIGNNVSITGNCAIVDVSHPADAIERGLKIGEAIDPRRSHVVIGDNCFIGFGTMIMPNVTIGRNCIIGAGSVVTRDIPDNSVASGAPARVIRSRSPDGENAV
jgi:acetyltransferase-like isoleucine patch superfamily enzyme